MHLRRHFELILSVRRERGVRHELHAHMRGVETRVEEVHRARHGRPAPKQSDGGGRDCRAVYGLAEDDDDMSVEGAIGLPFRRDGAHDARRLAEGHGEVRRVSRGAELVRHGQVECVTGVGRHGQRVEAAIDEPHYRAVPGALIADRRDSPVRQRPRLQRDVHNVALAHECGGGDLGLQHSRVDCRATHRLGNHRAVRFRRPGRIGDTVVLGAGAEHSERA